MCSRLPCYSNTCSIHYWTAVFFGRSRRKKHEFVTNWVSKFIAVCIVLYGRLWPPQIAYSVWGPRQDIMSYSSPPTSGRGWGGGKTKPCLSLTSDGSRHVGEGKFKYFTHEFNKIKQTCKAY